jgi:hypothetical protein
MNTLRRLRVFWKVLHGECPNCDCMLDYRGFTHERPFCPYCKWEPGKR